MDKEIKMLDLVELTKDIYYFDSGGETTFKKGAQGTVVEVFQNNDYMVELDVVDDLNTNLTFGLPVINKKDLKFVEDGHVQQFKD